MARGKQTTITPWVVLPGAALLTAGMMWWSIGSPSRSSESVVYTGPVPAKAEQKVVPAERFRKYAQTRSDLNARLQTADVITDEAPVPPVTHQDVRVLLRPAGVSTTETSTPPVATRASAALLQPAPLDAIADLHAVLIEGAIQSSILDRTLHDTLVSPRLVLSDLDSAVVWSAGMSARNTARLSDFLSFWSETDARARVNPYRMTLEAIERDLSSRRRDDPDVVELLALLARLPEAEMWDTMDGPSLERLFKIKTRWCRPGTSEHRWAKLGLVGAVYYQRRYTEALMLSEGLRHSDWDGFDAEQRSEWEWQYGLIHSMLKEPSKALESYRVVAVSSHRHAVDARFRVVSTLINMGDKQAAEQSISEYYRLPDGFGKVSPQMLSLMLNKVSS